MSEQLESKFELEAEKLKHDLARRETDMESLRELRGQLAKVLALIEALMKYKHGQEVKR